MRCRKKSAEDRAHEAARKAARLAEQGQVPEGGFTLSTKQPWAHKEIVVSAALGHMGHVSTWHTWHTWDTCWRRILSALPALQVPELTDEQKVCASAAPPRPVLAVTPCACEWHAHSPCSLLPLTLHRSSWQLRRQPRWRLLGWM